MDRSVTWRKRRVVLADGTPTDYGFVDSYGSQPTTDVHPWKAGYPKSYSTSCGAISAYQTFQFTNIDPLNCDTGTQYDIDHLCTSFSFSLPICSRVVSISDTFVLEPPADDSNNYYLIDLQVCFLAKWRCLHRIGGVCAH